MTKKTQELLDKLADRYDQKSNMGSRYAFLPEVRGGTGWSRESRADAIVMDLWPSDGLELTGFELKTSRADWLRELKSNGTKSDPLKQFCDRWYLVTYWDGSRRTLYEEELPADWGHMELYYDGKIYVRKEAPKIEAKPVDRPLLASIMRIASKGLSEVFINGRTYQLKP